MTTAPPKKPEEHDFAELLERIDSGIKAILMTNGGQSARLWLSQKELETIRAALLQAQDVTRAEPPCDDAWEAFERIVRTFGSNPENFEEPYSGFINDVLEVRAAIRPAPISVEVLEGMKREWSGSFVLCEKSAARGYNAALDDVKAIIAKLRGE